MRFADYSCFPRAVLQCDWTVAVGRKSRAKGLEWRQFAPYCSQTAQLKACGIRQGCSLGSVFNLPCNSHKLNNWKLVKCSMRPALNIYSHCWNWYKHCFLWISALLKVLKSPAEANYTIVKIIHQIAGLILSECRHPLMQCASITS